MTDISAIASPDAPTVVNTKGGAQSDIPARFDLIDGPALFEMAKVLDHGAKKYGENNWRKIDVDDHLNHLIMHTYAYLAGDRTDDHLSHILCRAMFALGVALEESEDDMSEISSYVEYQEEMGEHATKYIVGDLGIDGHVHLLYLRDDLPVATTSVLMGDVQHAHSIEADSSERGFICKPAKPGPHTHTKFTKVEST